MSRLHRLEQEHLELALGLYHDRALIRHLLSTVQPPASVERIALNLGPPAGGPWLIVSRDGHFVTCLGASMQLLPDQYIVERKRLDQISASVEALRELVAVARSGGRVQTQRQLARIGEAGSGLSQQEFDALACWLPLLRLELLESRTAFSRSARELGEQLRRRKKLRKRDHELAHAYWRSSWAVVHVTMLLASDGGATARDLCARLGVTHPELALELAWGLVRTGVSSFAMRGAWLSSKLLSHSLPLLKRRYVSEQATALSQFSDALGLVAIGLRHRRYRAQVRKTLARTGGAALPSSTLVRGHARDAFTHLDQNLEATRNHTLALSRRFAEEVFAGHPKAEQVALAAWPDDVVGAFFMAVPVDIWAEQRAIRSLFEWLAWVVSIEARDFYVPAPLIEMWRGPWRLDDALELLSAQRRGDDRPQPRKVELEPRRNAACPCGRGRKYKRCCGA